MKAMVLAAGLGERMRPLTHHTPKPLLAVNGEPLLARHFRAIAAAGIHDVVINVSWLAEQIIEFCGDGSRWGLNIQISREPEPLETAGGIINALPLLGDAPFLLVNGDVYTDYRLSELCAAPLQPGGAAIVLVPNPAHHPGGDFGIQQARVVPKSAGQLTYTYSGIGVYQAAFFAGAVPAKQPLKPWLDRAIADGVLEARIWQGIWSDVGTPERLAELNDGLKAAE